MNITLRIRSEEGVQRIQVGRNDSVEEIYKHIESREGYYLSKDPQGQYSLSPNLPLSEFNNGDFIFLHRLPLEPMESLDGQEGGLDSIDLELEKRPGVLQRGLDPHACRHGPKGMCEHCLPLEPWQIPSVASAKHLPLHVYLRQAAIRVSDYFKKGDTNIPIPQAIIVCKEHPEKEMCSKCIPQAVTLKRQPYRLVDHVEFTSSSGVEQVVGEWRRTGLQRFAWLFGEIVPRSSEPWDLDVWSDLWSSQSKKASLME
jgi:NPL4 family, putative zinc binding region